MAGRERSVVTAQNRSRKGLCRFRLRPGASSCSWMETCRREPSVALAQLTIRARQAANSAKIPVFCHVERVFGLGVVPVLSFVAPDVRE